MTAAMDDAAHNASRGVVNSQAHSTPAPPKKSRAELQADAARARAQLAATLDAIEDKLNVPKQMGLAAERTGQQVRTLAAEKPLALAGIALAAAAAVGLGVWAIVRAVTK